MQRLYALEQMTQRLLVTASKIGGLAEEVADAVALAYRMPEVIEQPPVI
jgi:hypothetical protein